MNKVEVEVRHSRRLWPEAYHLFKTELLSVSVGLWMYAEASPFSLALAILVRDPVLSLLSELKFLQKKRPKSRRGSCLVLPHASYGPSVEIFYSAGSRPWDKGGTRSPKIFWGGLRASAWSPGSATVLRNHIMIIWNSFRNAIVLRKFFSRKKSR